MAKQVKKVDAVITESRMHHNEVSIRDRDGEDIRPALTEAGFQEGEKVVVLLESDYRDLRVSAPYY